VLDVAILGDLNRVYTASVTPEGTVLIPSIGVANVLGMNIDQAERRIRDLVFRLYRNIDVSLSLAQLRTFKVFVVGGVEAPGVQVATSATRVSEVVPPQTRDGVVRRNVLLRRSDGDTLLVDLARFRQTGDLSANPTLREGDALVVPTLDETVQVFGRVAFPGTYEYHRNESLADFLRIANGGGGFPSNASDTIRVTRFVSAQQREFLQFSRADALGARGQQFRLQPFDAVFVAEVANYKEQKTATITGQVVRPGTYPIRPDTTTIRDLVELAGGFTREASLVDATLRRSSSPTPQRGLRTLSQVPPELLSPEERQILQITSQSDPRAVVIDFPRLFAAGVEIYDQKLQAGDTLDVPTLRNEVTVLGAVAQPGIVQHVAGRNVQFFIRVAGGFTRQADMQDVMVLKRRMGTRLHWRDVKSLDPGDTVIVPFRERRRWVETLQSTNAVVTTVTGLILTFVALFGS
jgi:protein involved in polysaccharide export with SLBB domain